MKKFFSNIFLYFFAIGVAVGYFFIFWLTVHGSMQSGILGWLFFVIIIGTGILINILEYNQLMPCHKPIQLYLLVFGIGAMFTGWNYFNLRGSGYGNIATDMIWAVQVFVGFMALFKGIEIIKIKKKGLK
ncbi:MAG: hypothetical protein PHE59_01595 [Patescibacteria group bacterium]|nr:hypothetical protein [Patescibacteria group bacterium]MDD5164498.1 hypothetical protein [Patescibacteria group bacterium]MDD5534148.1 hypothetical protein [Patescibacteria group bacterium]